MVAKLYEEGRFDLMLSKGILQKISNILTKNYVEVFIASEAAFKEERRLDKFWKKYFSF